jgi:Uma2 family endonuclease
MPHEHAIQIPPRTIMEAYRSLPEGTLAELIEGSLYMSPAPSANHQRLVGKLYRLFSAHVDQHKIGEVFIAPLDVYLDETMNAVQPDLLFVKTNNLHYVKADGMHGVPDLIVEVLSPGTLAIDLDKKKSLYEAFKVTEYWIVNPDSKEVTGFQLEGEKFIKHPAPIGSLSSKLLGDFNF